MTDKLERLADEVASESSSHGVAVTSATCSVTKRQSPDDMKSAETIFAFASGTSRAAIAVLRLTGPKTRAMVEAIAGRVPEPRRATLVTFVDPARCEKIDRGILVFFPAPGSFTGEDYAEFHLHGSRAVAAAMIEALATSPGTRPAEPGEFTRRAFINGKLDLAQVEGIGDLIEAETAWQHRQALRQMEGVLGRQAGLWRQALIEASALVEAEIDFSDEADVPAETSRRIAEVLRPIAGALETELAAARAGELVREGLTIVIAGRPNAGKSTLLNALARRDIAIVSPVPGTTRDSLEAHLDLAGFRVTLIDTAGMRATEDEIEQIGVDRALARARTADLVLWLSDIEALESPPPDFDGLVIWKVLTKIDLRPGAASGFPDPALAPDALAISAETGENLDLLLERISGFAASRTFGGFGGLITRERHRAAFASTAQALRRILANLNAPVELLAEDLRVARFSLERLTGTVDVEDILGDIFSQFCIGK
jgi:tRNA modification GTPase